MHESLFDDELRAFQRTFRRFVDDAIAPHHRTWEEAGIVPRALWTQAGALGALCPTLDPRFGGAGLDFRFSAVVIEELARRGAHGPGFPLHSDIVASYLEHHGDDSQRQRWLPAMAAGTCIGAIAMTEPGTGSDLQGIQSTARLDGDAWVLSGTKTFVSNGHLCDLVIVACRTEDEGPKSQRMSLLVVERDTPGFVRGKRLEKIGLHAQDTAELHFEDCRVPKENLLGARGAGFAMLMGELARERLVIAIGCVAAAEAALDVTVAYVKERHAFGKPLSQQQNTRFRIAEMATEVELGGALVDRCIQAMVAGNAAVHECAMAKWWTSEMLGRIVDAGVQLHGGYGFMREYDIARAYLDARVQRIYGGTTEIMKELVARSLL